MEGVPQFVGEAPVLSVKLSGQAICPLNERSHRRRSSFLVSVLAYTTAA